MSGAKGIKQAESEFQPHLSTNSVSRGRFPGAPRRRTLKGSLVAGFEETNKIFYVQEEADAAIITLRLFPCQSKPIIFL